LGETLQKAQFLLDKNAVSVWMKGQNIKKTRSIFKCIWINVDEKTRSIFKCIWINVDVASDKEKILDVLLGDPLQHAWEPLVLKTSVSSLKRVLICP